VHDFEHCQPGEGKRILQLPSEKRKKPCPWGGQELFLHMLILSGQDQPTMESMRIVILPGLDGTDLLLARFIELVPVGFTATVMPLPDDPADDYESLSCALASRLRDYAPCHLVAESFSGPVGIRIASRHPDIVNGLTLVASFASSPAPWIARWLPWSLIFRISLPYAVARYFFVGANYELAGRFRDAIRQTSSATLTKRIHCLLNVDVCSELASLRCPVRYLRPKCDRLVPAHVLRTILDANGNVIVHEIDGPHLILQTRPEQAWSAITDVGCNQMSR
jgi:pimeloyl-[acyl-carrier protein] methyl ester esterase